MENNLRDFCGGASVLISACSASALGRGTFISRVIHIVPPGVTSRCLGSPPNAHAPVHKTHIQTGRRDATRLSLGHRPCSIRLRVGAWTSRRIISRPLTLSADCYTCPHSAALHRSGAPRPPGPQAARDFRKPKSRDQLRHSSSRLGGARQLLGLGWRCLRMPHVTNPRSKWRSAERPKAATQTPSPIPPSTKHTDLPSRCHRARPHGSRRFSAARPYLRVSFLLLTSPLHLTKRARHTSTPAHQHPNNNTTTPTSLNMDHSGHGGGMSSMAMSGMATPTGSAAVAAATGAAAGGGHSMGGGSCKSESSCACLPSPRVAWLSSAPTFLQALPFLPVPHFSPPPLLR